jgi:hypothetical protein
MSQNVAEVGRQRTKVGIVETFEMTLLMVVYESRCCRGKMTAMVSIWAR